MNGNAGWRKDRVPWVDPSLGTQILCTKVGKMVRRWMREISALVDMGTPHTVVPKSTDEALACATINWQKIKVVVPVKVLMWVWKLECVNRFMQVTCVSFTWVFDGKRCSVWLHNPYLTTCCKIKIVNKVRMEAINK